MYIYTVIHIYLYILLFLASMHPLHAIELRLEIVKIQDQISILGIEALIAGGLAVHHRQAQDNQHQDIENERQRA